MTEPEMMSTMDDDEYLLEARKYRHRKLLVETARELYVHACGSLEDCVTAAEALLRLCGLEEPGRTAEIEEMQ